jgi:hypothetical protein
MAGWGTALVILYVIAAQAGDGPPRLAAPLVGVAVYLLLELFDRFLAAVAAGPEMDPLGPRQLRTIARSALIGCASALVVLVAENLISTTGPLPLALAGLCALAAAAAVILLSTGEGQT